MNTYGQFYNPKQPDNKSILLILGFIVAFILCMVFIGCNSVKKATDISISRSDSSSTQKTDSSSVQKNDVTTETKSRKEWDKETVIEFQSWPFATIGGVSPKKTDSLNLAYSEHNGTITPWVIVEDGIITVVNKPIKSITTRSKGKDSSSTKTVDKSETATELNKESKSDLKTYHKEKTKTKESKRTSSVLIAFVLLLAAIIGFAIAHKFRP